MTDRTEPSEAVKSIAAALVRADARYELNGLLEKEQGIMRAERVIYAKVSAWVGREVPFQAPIPIVRDGEEVAQLAWSALTGTPARRVAEQARRLKKQEIVSKIKSLSSIRDACSATLSALGSAGTGNLIALEAHLGIRRGQYHEAGQASLQTRVVREIGVFEATAIGLADLQAASSSEVERLETLLEGISARKRGRPKNEAPYAVALALARLYAKVTGKKPTYSEDSDGPSGEFTPALRDVFDALGWQTVQCRGPATAAKDAITDADTSYERNWLGASFSAGPSE